MCQYSKYVINVRHETRIFFPTNRETLKRINACCFYLTPNSETRIPTLHESISTVKSLSVGITRKSSVGAASKFRSCKLGRVHLQKQTLTVYLKDTYNVIFNVNGKKIQGTDPPRYSYSNDSGP